MQTTQRLSMSAIDKRFELLKTQNKKALMPFITAGDPDLETTVEMIDRFDQLGCGFCELGIPYSDPIADGPVIQASYTRALEQGVAPTAILDAIGKRKSSEMPVVLMVSYAIVFRVGVDAFIDRAKTANAAGLIVPDLPASEADSLGGVCASNDLSLVQLIAPTTPRERAKRIAEKSQGFIYYVSISGTTGERTELPTELIDNVAWLKEQTDTPVCVGFGISQCEQAQQVAKFADGVIVGSAIVRRVSEIDPADRAPGIEAVHTYVESLVNAIE